ncbi:MAG: dicarboxylate/amino acid:cation symporter [Gammaproteobacteria bacterium]
MKRKKLNFTGKILIALIAGIITGYILSHFQSNIFIKDYVTHGFLDVFGRIFIAVLKMLVVPIVFVSLVCGVGKLHNTGKIGVLALKTILLYILTTMFAIFIAITFSNLFDIGSGLNLSTNATVNLNQAPSLQETLINIIPTNPFDALAKGNMLQIIVFALLLGYAIAAAGNAGKRISMIFDNLNTILIKLIYLVLWIAPLGVFCLITKLLAERGIAFIGYLAGYFTTEVFVLFLHWAIVYPCLIFFLARLNPLTFMKKIMTAALFAFSTSSSNASIPVTLETATSKLGIHNSIASFIVPLGATINMDGTAIMQGVATVFIAHVYAIHIGFTGYLTVILMATLASIGTAAIPSAGMITLAMVLQHVGLPVEGITLVLGVDRLLDMTRTAVNITGDCTVAAIIAKSEQALNKSIFDSATDESSPTETQIANWHQ